MSKTTNVKRVYWEEAMEHGDERMVFELEDGRKMELAVYGAPGAELPDNVVTHVHFQEL